jgi:hypothetical protein
MLEKLMTKIKDFFGIICCQAKRTAALDASCRHLLCQLDAAVENAAVRARFVSDAVVTTVEPRTTRAERDHRRIVKEPSQAAPLM